MERKLTVLLPADVYDRLETQARAEDRDPFQQARHLLRRLLEADSNPLTPSEPPS